MESFLNFILVVLILNAIVFYNSGPNHLHLSTALSNPDPFTFLLVWAKFRSQNARNWFNKQVPGTQNITK